MIAVISDIHGNLWALEAVLRDLDRVSPQQVVVAGDLAFGGPTPGECVALIRRRGYPTIRGNTDEWLTNAPGAGVPGGVADAAAWTRARLTAEDRRYLSVLPFLWRTSHDAGDILVVHATPWSISDAVMPDASEATVVRVFQEAGAAAVVYGHIHIAYVRELDGRLLINPGSVGLPYDGDPRASYALFSADRGAWRTTLHRVDYDLSEALNASRQSDNPEGQRWARRLESASFQP